MPGLRKGKITLLVLDAIFEDSAESNDILCLLEDGNGEELLKAGFEKYAKAQGVCLHQHRRSFRGDRLLFDDFPFCPG